MGLLGIETAAAPKGMRAKRLAAFFIDAGIVLVLSFLAYQILGKPDFYSVKAAMDAAEAAGGQDPDLTAGVFATFDKAYGLLLMIAFAYEALTTVITGGATVGKLLFGLHTVPENPARGRGLHSLLLCLRGALKMLCLYLFQGIPFIICCLTIFTNGKCQTGFDKAIRSVTTDGKSIQ